MIAVDWGTTSLRAFLLDEGGQVVDVRRSEQGLLQVAGRFAEVLDSLIDGWDARLVVMAGMVGSRQGWREVPYVAAPAGVADIAAGMQALPDDALHGRELWLVPGLQCEGAGRVPDVMRGEEAQLCGLLSVLEVGACQVLLPGTHSKHVQVVDGRVERFATFMTGELYAVLRQHSLLGRMMVDAPHDDDAFAQGVLMASNGGNPLHHLFGVRTRALFGQLAPEQLSSYLSGLLIGLELAGAGERGDHFHVIASAALAQHYLAALTLLGRRATSHGEALVARGIHQLACARELPV